MDSGTWAAIGTAATAIFTGGALLLAWTQRQRVRLVIDPVRYIGNPLAKEQSRLEFAVKNFGSGPAQGVVVRYVFKEGSMPLFDGSVSIPAGESITCAAQWVVDSAPEDMTRDLSKSPKRPVVPYDLIEVTWLHPPKFEQRKVKHHSLQGLIDEQFRREGWTE